MHILIDEESTKEFAERFIRTLPQNSILALHGELGAGKTTFVQGVFRGMGGNEEEVHSPTFSYLHIYPYPSPLFHFDLYRLRHAQDFLAMGFDEYFSKQGVVVIEWPQRIESILPQDSIHVSLTYRGKEQREITIL